MQVCSPEFRDLFEAIPEFPVARFFPKFSRSYKLLPTYYIPGLNEYQNHCRKPIYNPEGLLQYRSGAFLRIQFGKTMWQSRPCGISRTHTGTDRDRDRNLNKTKPEMPLRLQPDSRLVCGYRPDRLAMLCLPEEKTTPSHTQPRPATPSHTQPHPATPSHTQPHPATPSHTQPHREGEVG
jgi:hypothetical protein